MVGILLVSHSNLIVQGTRELIWQVVAHNIKIEIAGGTFSNELGTDMKKIKSAIKNLSNCDEVLIFTDIGSSILMTEMVLDDLELDGLDISKFILTDAPLVEGSMIAAIETSLGKSAKTIIDILKNKKYKYIKR